MKDPKPHTLSTSDARQPGDGGVQERADNATPRATSSPHPMLRTLHGIPDDHVCVWGESEKAEDITAGDLRGLLEQLETLRHRVEYAEGVLTRDPFDENQRKFAAEILRDALKTPGGEATPFSKSSVDTPGASSPASEHGEFHAESLDERGIYGGRSYPASSPTERSGNWALVVPDPASEPLTEPEIDALIREGVSNQESKP